MIRAFAAGFLLATLPLDGAAIAKTAPLRVELCRLLSSANRFAGRSVEVVGIHVGDIELSYLVSPKCDSRHLTVGNGFDAWRLNELSGSLSVFRGTVRVVQNPRGFPTYSAFLDNPVLVRSERNVIPVEVWTGSDDGLTQRLADAVRDEFRQSALFASVPASTPNSLRVTIPTHVGWDEVGGRTRVTYKLRLDRGNRNLGQTGGVCWEDELRTCARQIVNETATAISR